MVIKQQKSMLKTSMEV